MVPHEDKHVGAAKRRQHYRLRYLPGLVYDAVVETPPREERVLDAEAGTANNPSNVSRDGDEIIFQLS